MNTCSIDGCGKPHQARGWCNAHYTRWRQHGDPLIVLTPMSARGEPLRWLLEVALPYEGDDCLIWPFGQNGDGYGTVRIDGKHQLVHRVVCQRRHGPPPTPKHDSAHSCGRGGDGCCNPGHTRWATRAENEADKVAHGRANRGERHGCAKLTDAQARAIRADPRKGVDIAADYGISPQTISGIKAGTRWAVRP